MTLPLQPALPLALADILPAAGVLARAFYSDPFFTYALPEAARRERMLPWFYEKFLRYGLTYGQVYTTPSLEGVAIWLGPEKHTLAWLGIIQSGLIRLPLKLRLSELQRSLRLSNYADRLHAAAVSAPHWYLCELGVEPSRQGRGVGRLLLQPVLARADSQSLCCYLETNNEQNLPFYQSNGFSVVNQGQAASDSPVTWAMLRKPA